MYQILATQAAVIGEVNGNNFKHTREGRKGPGSPDVSCFVISWLPPVWGA